MPSVQEARHQLETEENDHGDFEQKHSTISSDVENQPKRFLYAAQLHLEGLEAVREVEFRAQVVVDLVHRRVFPRLVRLVQVGRESTSWWERSPCLSPPMVDELRILAGIPLGEDSAEATGRGLPFPIPSRRG